MRSTAEIAGIAFVALGTVPALLSAMSILGYFIDRNGYRFGTEVAGYMYSSPYHYIGLNALIVGLFALAIMVKSWLTRIVAVILQFVLFIAAVLNW
jgi:hypothetical protein